MNTPAVERRQQAYEWAVALGAAHDLGECRGVYEQVHGRISAKGCGCFSALAGILIGIPFAGTATGSLRIALICAVTVAVVGGVALTRVRPRMEKSDVVALFQRGIAQLTVKDVVPRLIPWQRLADFYVSYVAPGDEDGRTGDLRGVRVTSADGIEIAAGTGYGRRAIARLRDDMEQAVTALRLPSAIGQYDSGVPVLFGSLLVSQQGIAWNDGAKHAAWEKIRGFEVYPYQLAIFTGKLGGPAIPPADVPDWCVAIGLIREVAARRGIPERPHR